MTRVLKKDISEFNEGDTVQCMSGKYEVLSFNYLAGSRPRKIISSTCKNIDTGKETIISWGKNKNFIKV